MKRTVGEKYLIAKEMQRQGKGYGTIARLLGYKTKSGAQHLLNSEHRQKLTRYTTSIIFTNPQGDVRFINATADNLNKAIEDLNEISLQAASDLIQMDKVKEL